MKIRLLGAILGLLFVACRTTTPPPQLTAGFRYSAYGPDFDPGLAYWTRVGTEMAGRFPDAKPAAVWIVSRLSGFGTEMNFPGSSTSPRIHFSADDANEEALKLFDQRGFACWLQVEPGNAPVEELIHLTLDRYSHHPCVVGIGVDVEWYRSVENPDGVAVTDAEATAWLAAVRRHNPRYRLFLKHWLTEKMPPTVRDGILFINDSQIFPSMQAMVDEFAVWGRTFAPAPVGFQYGYEPDKPWWQALEDPPRQIGEQIRAVVPNLEGLYWVDFTVLDVFPPPPELAATHAARASQLVMDPIVGVKIYELPERLDEVSAAWRDLGVTTAFASENVAADEGFRRMAANIGVDVFVIFPVFQNPEALKADPDLLAVTAEGKPAREEWLEFVCPSRESYRQARVAQMRETMQRLRPAGVSLDFIRHFVFWEKVEPASLHGDIAMSCFCPHCIRNFSASKGITVPAGDTKATAAWILDHHAANWMEWRVELIDSMASALATAARDVDPAVKIDIHAVPWRRFDFGGAVLRSVGQNLETLSKVADFVSPMCYAHMQQRAPDWIHSVIVRLDEQSSAPILPSIQVREAYRPGVPFTAAEFEQHLREALKVPSRGVVFWSWEALQAEPAKLRVAARMLAPLRSGGR